MRQPLFLPMSREEMAAHGWDVLDILLVSGDAYVDHPSFGTALLGRWLVAHGFRVGVVSQPRWENRDDALADLTRMGLPRLFAGVTAGALDSMLAHYTAFRKKRHDDAYTPGGQCGARPNRAIITYTGLVRQAFPGLPVVIGGIEASLRRISHYDFWSDSLRRSLLLDSKADLLVYGMGETALLSIARTAARLADASALPQTGARLPAPHPVPASDAPRSARAPRIASDALSPGLDRSILVEACRAVPGLVWSMPAKNAPTAQPSRYTSKNAAPESLAAQYRPLINAVPDAEITLLPSHEDMLRDPALLMRATLALEEQVHHGLAHAIQPAGDRLLILTPPAPPLPERDLDSLYDLPYSRLPHPAYTAPIPAWEMIRTSITTHRGCGGGCSFCSLALHQSRHIASRSRDSIVREASRIAQGPAPDAQQTASGRTRRSNPPGGGAIKGAAKSFSAPRRDTAAPGKSSPPRWAGSISDVGGPSANMWQARCTLPDDKRCARQSCMHPAVCPFFAVDQSRGARLLREIAALPGIRNVRIASGVRFDLALQDEAALFAYTSEFTGGQLKVAPEHSAAPVLELMRKPSMRVFEKFLETFARQCKKTGKELYTVPYLMSAFPGCTEAHMHELAAWLRRKNWRPQQVQCFIPTPGTVATAMFYARQTPDGAPLYVARTDKERLRQHHILVGKK